MGAAMFEVIISSVSTGLVRRKTFATRHEVDKYVDRFMDAPVPRRVRRNFRVEVHFRPQPLTRPTLPAPNPIKPAA
jgi:hypothetical protein